MPGDLDQSTDPKKKKKKNKKSSHGQGNQRDAARESKDNGAEMQSIHSANTTSTTVEAISYKIVFAAALQAYKAAQPRHGFKRGFFADYRHTGHLSILDSQSEINEACDKGKYSRAMVQIIGLLAQRKKNANNHSFVMYLLDELKSAYPQQNWNDLDPKPLFISQGVLYHSTNATPEMVFQHGLVSQKSSELIEDYVQRTEFGIPTTTDQRSALKHAYAPVEMKEDEPEIYIYQINYRGVSGVDIAHTTTIREDNSIKWSTSQSKKVNIIGRVTAADIVGAWKLPQQGSGDSSQPQWIANKNYQKTRATDLSKEPIVNILTDKVTQYLQQQCLSVIPEKTGNTLR